MDNCRLAVHVSPSRSAASKALNDRSLATTAHLLCIADTRRLPGIVQHRLDYGTLLRIVKSRQHTSDFCEPRFVGRNLINVIEAPQRDDDSDQCALHTLSRHIHIVAV